MIYEGLCISILVFSVTTEIAIIEQVVSNFQGVHAVDQLRLTIKKSADCVKKLLLKIMVRQRGSTVQHGIDKRQGAAKCLSNIRCKLDKR